MAQITLLQRLPIIAINGGCMSVSREKAEKFATVLNELKELDEEAARWLLQAAKNGDVRYAGTLDNCMNWAGTPQGHDYWNNLANRMPLHGW